MPAAYASIVPQSAFRSDIQGLRAVAILAVLGFHYHLPMLTGGFAGVDIFFVISGFLITGQLLGELEKRGGIDFAAFYGRRMRRLLPALLVVTLATILCGTVLLSPAEQRTMAHAAGYSSFYVSNFWFARQAMDYFAPESAASPFLHTWSLSVEEQFYIVWPGLLALVQLVRPPRRRPAPIAASMGLLTVASFALCLWLMADRQPWAFYASPARGWEFGIGSLASLAPVRNWGARCASAPAAGWAGLAVMLASLIAIREDFPFPAPGALLPACATAVVIFAGSNKDGRGPASLLSIAPLQWIGKLSYSIYLWHWPIIAYAKILDPQLAIGGYFACAALTLALASLTFRLVEQPLRSDRRLTRSSRSSLKFGGVLTACGLIAALCCGLAARWFAGSGMQRIIAQAAAQPSTATQSNHYCLAGFLVGTPYPCDLGARRAERTIIVFGDSHGDQWTTPLAAIASAQGWHLVTYLKSGCPVADVPIYVPRLKRYSPECAAWRAQALAAIASLRPDAVIVAQFSRAYVQGSGNRLGRHAATLPAWRAGLLRSLRALRAAKIPVVLLQDSPTPDSDVPTCLGRADWRGELLSQCDTPRARALDPAIVAAERAAARNSGSAYVDMTDRFCDASLCPAILKGDIVYRDNSHLATRYTAQLAGPLAGALLPLIAAPAANPAGPIPSALRGPPANL
jgi:peptidoglycan/LPS O-acetylase OafA/YrhL